MKDPRARPPPVKPGRTPAPLSARAPQGPFLVRHRRAVLAAGVLLALGLTYPAIGGAIARRMIAARLSARLGRPVFIDSGRAGLGTLVLHRLVVTSRDPARPALVVAERIDLPFAAAWGGGDRPVEVRGLRLDVRRGGEADNVTDLIEKMRKRDGGTSAASGRTLPSLVIRGGSLLVDDAARGLHATVKAFDARVEPGRRFEARLRDVAGTVRLGGPLREAAFGGTSVEVTGRLAGLKPDGPPSLKLAGWQVAPISTLDLTGIEGTVAPDPASPGRIVVDLHGGWGGSRETLWVARGGVDPAARAGSLALKAERFSLDKIADVLPKSVLHPEQAKIDAELTVTLAGQSVRFAGELGVSGLSFQHPGLAPEPIENLVLALRLSGTAYPEHRRVDIDRLEAQVQDLVGRVDGSLELAPGEFVFADGSKLGSKPKVELHLSVPKIPCAKLLASIPAALVPKLKGFQLAGTFEADVATKVDYEDLEALDLRGKVGIDGCRVLAAPESMSARALADSLTQRVDVPKAPGVATSADDTEPLTFIVGPENPDFVPFEEISPFLVNSIMTTEDSGFFKHRGWVTSEFKSALKRNLERGGFRLGASSITMQMVKNVLLSQQKTLSRKLQELFLVWYVEQNLPKERILELYFNAIEFGPRLYGIGMATRHYFGKRPSELTPLEAAFFSSILPSPKRRYIQYCHGSLFPPWEKYVRRILAKVHERGRLTDAEYASAAAQTLTFDRIEALPEKACLDWVKKITTHAEGGEPVARPEGEAPAAGEGE